MDYLFLILYICRVAAEIICGVLFLAFDLEEYFLAIPSLSQCAHNVPDFSRCLRVGLLRIYCHYFMVGSIKLPTMIR